MKTLLLAPQLPYPPHKGTAMRNFHLIRHLGARHDLTLLTFQEPGVAPEVAELRRHCRRVETVAPPRRSRLVRFVDLLACDKPDLVRRLWSPTMVERLAGLLRAERYDLVQIEGLEMAPHWGAAAMMTDRRPPVVLDEHNAEYVLQRRAFQIDARQPARWLGAAYSLAQWQKLARYERHFCRSAGGVVAASELDRQALLALDSRLRVAVVPNGVDVAHYRDCAAEQGPRQGEQRVIFVGTLDFRPNVDGLLWFAHRIWPLVQKAAPRASLWIVGGAPVRMIAGLADGARVFVERDVADVRPYLAKASLSVVPLRIGGGSRLKVLEAMAAGVPVVSTTLGCEGIAVTPETALLADRPEEMAQGIVDLLGDRERRDRLARAARTFVEQHYDWRVIGPKMEEAQREVVGA